MKQRILLLFTNHRVAEKLWPIIPVLSKNYVIDLFRNNIIIESFLVHDVHHHCMM